jgi:hypothetical protein
MGFATNAVIFFAILSIFVTFSGQGIACKSSTLDTILAAFTTGQLPSNFNIVQAATDAGIFATATIIIGTFVFPNPYVIFGGFALGLLISWSGIPFQMFGCGLLPDPISKMFTALFGFAIALGIIYWFKGGTGEN